VLSLGGSPDKKTAMMGGAAGEQVTVQQPTELDVVDGYYEGMPHFFDSVDHKVTRTATISTGNGYPKTFKKGTQGRIPHDCHPL